MSAWTLRDWQTAADIVKDVALAGAAVFSAFIAWRGLNRWRLEQAGKVYFEAGLNLARRTYQLKDALNNARTVFTMSGEFPEDYIMGSGSKEDESSAWQHVFNNRYKSLLPVAVEFQTAGLEAEALWGLDARQKVDALLQCVTRLRIGMENRLREIKNGKQQKVNAEEIIFGNTNFPDDENKFTAEIKQALDSMEKFLERRLSKFRALG